MTPATTLQTTSTGCRDGGLQHNPVRNRWILRCRATAPVDEIHARPEQSAQRFVSKPVSNDPLSIRVEFMKGCMGVGYPDRACLPKRVGTGRSRRDSSHLSSSNSNDT